MSNKHLVEEDQDASDDEEEKRISFSGVKNKTQRQKIAEEIGIVVEWSAACDQQLSRSSLVHELLLSPLQE